MDSDAGILSINGEPDEKVARQLRARGLRLTVTEVRRLADLIGRDPTNVEATLFDIMWSEHCSYKSSKELLKRYLPTRASNVVLGPGEDAGIVRLCEHEGDIYCLVMAHESHNHPSQVMPFEGAATGIGGIVRDVYCMGADVFAVMDALRFGDPYGPHMNKVREVISGVVSGIWQYGNALGVANMGGDVHFDSSYDENCLVNVIAVGVVKQQEIVRSRVPESAAREDYDIILVGKPTDASGFGGAAFASDVLDSDGLSESKAAVQVPDPFLKRVLAEANKKMLRLVQSRGVQIGFKDLGAGGIACATSEIASAGGFGALLDLSHVPVGVPKGARGLPPEVILCSETQERFALAVPSTFTPEVLHIYNEEFELPHIYNGARAVVIGKVTQDGRYRIQCGNGGLEDSAQGAEERPVESEPAAGPARHERCGWLCDVEAKTITSGISVRRKSRLPDFIEVEPDFAPPEDLGEFFVELLGSPNAASRRPIFSFYDCEVGGRTIVRPGDADAGVFAPIPGCSVGVAVSADGVPSYGKVSPYWAGALAVAEAMRNVACVGAAPRALSDCLNFGSPEVPDVFRAFEETTRGIGDAARRLWQTKTHAGQSGITGLTPEEEGRNRGYCPLEGGGWLPDSPGQGDLDSRGRGVGWSEGGEPVPIVTGNVSFYNQTSAGRAVAPSPIIACFGIMGDFSRAVTMGLKRSGSTLLLLGQRHDELGGSLYYEHLLGRLGRNVPVVRFESERASLHLVIEAIEQGLLRACHDISSGGLLLTLAEMCVSSRESLGASIDIDAIDGISGSSSAGRLRYDKRLFSESPGFVLEVGLQELNALLALAHEMGVRVLRLGAVSAESRLKVRENRQNLIDLSVSEMKTIWDVALEHALA